MNKKVKIILITAVSLLIAGSIGFMVWQTAQNGWKFNMDESGAGIFVVIGLVLTLLRICFREAEGNSRSLASYEKAYSEFIGSAFARPGSEKHKKELLRAAALYNENRFSSAVKKLEKLERACSSAADYRAVSFFKALIFSDIGNRREAISEYETVLKYDPHHSTALSNLGILYRKEGRDADALSCYRRATELDPDDAYAWNNLAQFYLSDGQWEAVLEPARRSLEKRSNMYQADTALCIALHMLGKPEESRKHYERAVMNGANGENIKRFIESMTD